MKDLTNQIYSIVIVASDDGFKAHLRFKNSKFDCDIARQSRVVLMQEVSRYIFTGGDRR